MNEELREKFMKVAKSIWVNVVEIDPIGHYTTDDILRFCRDWSKLVKENLLLKPQTNLFRLQLSCDWCSVSVVSSKIKALIKLFERRKGITLGNYSEVVEFNSLAESLTNLIEELRKDEPALLKLALSEKFGSDFAVTSCGYEIKITESGQIVVAEDRRLPYSYHRNLRGEDRYMVLNIIMGS